MVFVGGVTLHSFCGIGAGDAGLQRCIDLASRTASAQAWRKCKRLIIDEISMVDGEYFEVSVDICILLLPLFMKFHCFHNKKNIFWMS